MTAKSQTEIRARIAPELVDPLEAHFYELETHPWGIVQKERGDPHFVFGYFPDEATAGREYDSLKALFPGLPADFEATTVRDEDWQDAYKEFVRPWRSGRLHWVPLWERKTVAIDEGEAVVYLDAGMAFGTGSHETTRLCARRLLEDCEEHAAQIGTRRVIDAGCGSGVLALSAVALGYRKVLGFDFDPDAIAVCAGNAAENPHIAPIGFEVADLEAGLAGREADLLLANIQTDVLIPCADVIIRAVADGGTLALSGILRREAGEVRSRFEERFSALRPGLRISCESRADGEWSDLVFKLAV